MDEIVHDLRQDPVLVQQILGNGQTADISAALRDLADQVGQPVFVALVQRPPGLANDRPNDDLLRLIHQRLDAPGIYVVATQNSNLEVGSYDVPLDSTDLALAGYDATEIARGQLSEGDQLTVAAQAALTLRVAADPDLTLSASQVREITGDRTWLQPTAADDEPAGEPLTSMVVAVAAGVTALLLAWRLLRARAAPTTRSGAAVGTGPTSSRPDPVVDPDDLASVRRQARATLGRVESKLRRSKPEPAQFDRIRGCLDAAAARVDSADLLEVVGALVLAATAQAGLRKPPAVYHPCFFNPLHGEASSQVRAAGAGAVVPACSACANAVERGGEPEALMAGRGRRARPYYEGSSVWASSGFGSLVDDLWLRVDRTRR